MAYQFKKPKTANKPIHIVITALIALIAVAILIVWLSFSYLQNRPTEQPETPEETDTGIEIVTETASCLVILDMGENRQFVLVQTVPESTQVILAPIPAKLDTGSNDTLGDLLTRNGPVKVTETISNQLELPISNYFYFTPAGVNKFLSEMENGIKVKLPEPVTYTDENGIKSTVPSGTSTLTASQATAVLSYADWNKSQNASIVATRVMTSLFNNYMTSDYSLKGYFGTLSNVAQTNLRIDNFTAYVTALNHLAENNTGNIVTVVELSGTNDNGRFVPNIDDCRQNSGLYY